MTSGPRIAAARNLLVKQFLDSTAEWMWMLDTDMAFPTGTLDRLVKAADQYTRPIMGGLCFGGRKEDGIFPTLYALVDPETNDGSPIRTVYDFPDDAVVKVDATGAACLLVHRRVFTKIAGVFPEPQPWFSESVYMGREFGEDWTFCMRAAQLEIPVHVHTGIEIGHVKPRIIDRREFDRQKAMSR